MARSLCDWLNSWAKLDIGEDIAINHLSLDSRMIEGGDCFIAIKGEQANGETFIDSAIQSGAVVVLVDQLSSVKAEQCAALLVKIPELKAKVAELARSFYQTNEMPTIIGITGTNGKSTVAMGLCQAIKSLNKSAWFCGTIGYGDLDTLHSTNNTTPDVISNWRLINKAAQSNIEYVVMEVSSHGIAQGRVDGLPIKVAVFTNLTHEHLDYHQSMDAYGACKRQLLLMPSVKQVVINTCDAFGNQLAADQEICAQKWLLTDHFLSENKFVKIESISPYENGLHITFGYLDTCYELDTKLLGRFNAENLLQVLLTLLSLNISVDDALSAVANVEAVTGRMQAIRKASGPLVVIDYAHTPDALENALASVREHSRNIVWCVFGCGGDRDTAKRPLMGKIADHYADRIILTNDNPRTESEDNIIQQIASGIQNQNKIQIIKDRKSAILFAVQTAGSDDVILVAGKGHEDYQEVNGKRIHFSDIETANDALGACA